MPVTETNTNVENNYEKDNSNKYQQASAKEKKRRAGFDAIGISHFQGEGRS